MKFYINQSIHIHSIRITTISNSSIFQIGSAGIIKSLSTLSNTGKYIEEVAPIPSSTVVTKEASTIPFI